MAVQKHNTYYDNELYYYDEHGVRKPLQVGKVYSAGSGIKIENDIISVSGKYVSSADHSLDGKQLVLKDNKWEELVLPPSSDWLPTIKEASANSYNAATAWTNEQGYLTAHQIIPSAKWENASDVVVSNSAKWNDGYTTLTTNSADWMNVSAIPNLATKDELNTASSTLNTNKLDKTEFDEYKDFVAGELPKKQDKSAMSAYALSSWVDENYQKKGNYLSANALNEISGASANWNSVYETVQTNSGDWGEITKVKTFKTIGGIDAETSADSLEFSAGENIKIGINEGKIYVSSHDTTYDENDFISASHLNNIVSVSANVKSNSADWTSAARALEASANDWNKLYEEYQVSSKLWNDATDVVNTFSGDWNDVSSKANSADLIALSGKVNDLSAEFEKVVYTSATTNWDVIHYSAGQNINITNHTISSKDWLPEIKEASANAVDVVEGNFDKTPDNKFSGYNGTPFYVKQKTVSGTKPIIVNEYEDKYNIEFEEEYKKFIEEVSAKLYTSALPTVESLTPDYLNVELVENQDGTSAWLLSAAEQKNYKPGDYIDIDENDYINVTGLHNVTLSSTDKSIGISATTGENGDVNFNLSVDQVEVPNISGYNGIVATFNKETNQYEVGFKENDYAYLFGHYGNNSTLTDGTILKLDSNNYYKISIDEYGYITLPQTTNKFTFCINEYIDDNTTQNHEYLLNKLVLSAKNSDSIVTSQNYYPSEVGSSNVTLALTIDNSISPKEYCIVYKGSDVAANKLKIEASILEEVTSLDSSRGEVSGYTGREPIRIVQNSRIVELLYDEDVFTLKEDASLGAKKLTIESQGGEVVNKETFDKLLDSINSRIVETIPIGTINYHSYISAGQAISYIFRPMIEFEMNQQTTARIIAGNASAMQSQVMISVYELNETSYKLDLIWWSELKTLTQSKGEQVLLANNDVGQTRSIKPDGLYYVRMICLGQQIQQLLGLQNSVQDDLGDYDLVYVDSTTNTNPYYYIGHPAGDLGQTANSTLKPYVGFKNVGSNS